MQQVPINNLVPGKDYYIQHRDALCGASGKAIGQHFLHLLPPHPGGGWPAGERAVFQNIMRVPGATLPIGYTNHPFANSQYIFWERRVGPLIASKLSLNQPMKYYHPVEKRIASFLGGRRSKRRQRRRKTRRRRKKKRKTRRKRRRRRRRTRRKKRGGMEDGEEEKGEEMYSVHGFVLYPPQTGPERMRMRRAARADMARQQAERRRTSRRRDK